MERPPSSPKKKSPKQGKAKKSKPVKVVYISNPMKIKASVAEFRAVVQELTGQDSDVADFSKYAGPAGADENPAAADDCESLPPPSDHSSSAGIGVAEPPQPPNPDGGGADLRSDDAYGRTMSPGGGFHDVAPAMFDDFPGFFPSPLYYGP